MSSAPNSTQPILELSLHTEWERLNLELVPGQKLILGRGSEADVLIVRPSVSQKHLELLWTGTELRIKDLGSSNGTFRLPQESPFTQATFPDHYQALELSLSKSIVKFSWRPKVQPIEGTEILVDSTEVLNAENKKSKLFAADFFKKESTEKATAPKKKVSRKKKDTKLPGLVVEDVAPNVAIPKMQPSPRSISHATVEVSRDQALLSLGWLLASALLLILSYVPWKGIFQGLLTAAPKIWTDGAALDVWIAWYVWLSKGGILLWVLAIALLWSLNKKVFLSCGRFSGRGLPILPASLCLGIKFLGVAFCVLAFSWPALLAWQRGAKVSTWAPLRKIYAMQVGTQNDRLIEQSQYLREQSFKLKGSSLLYARLFAVNQQRVVHECEGRAESTWENKKVCLILLSAVGIETYDEVRPALLGDVAARIAIVLSLDGMIRVLASEGVSAPVLPFFLNSMDIVGLDQERKDLSDIVFSTTMTPAKITATLQQLKLIMNRRISGRQLELRVPAFLRVEAPASVELGI